LSQKIRESANGKSAAQLVGEPAGRPKNDRQMKLTFTVRRGGIASRRGGKDGALSAVGAREKAQNFVPLL
jgi:hypothetical protein